MEQKRQYSLNFWEELTELENYSMEIELPSFPGVFNFDFGSTILPTDIYDLFLTEKIQKAILVNSNTYGFLNFKPNQQTQCFREIEIHDLRKFLAILYAMGISRYPELSMHWKNNDFYNSKFIRNVMGRRKFEHIKKILHISDPENEYYSSDPYSKIQPFYNELKKQCNTVYRPEQCISLDESMIKYKGRNKMKQYLPMKPTKWGFKCFVIAEASTGYVSNFHIYEGDNLQEKRSTVEIALSLLDIFKNESFYVFMDSYYTSIPLFEALLNNGIYATGTIRKTRKHLPFQFKNEAEKMSKGKARFWRKKRLLLALWKDKKPVSILSNVENASMSNAIGSRANLIIPSCIQKYSCFMRGVDKFDQKLGYYRYNHRFSKWWKNCFVYLMEICMINSHIIYNKILLKRGERSMDHMTFREIIIRRLSEYNQNILS